MNENFPRILGHTAGELTSRPLLDFVHPDDRAQTVTEIVRLSAGEPSVQFLNRYRHARGHYLWLEWGALAVPEERAIYAVARDVTERVAQAEAHRRAERARLHLAAVVDSAALAIYTTAPDGTILSWNPGAERLYGYTAEEIVGRSIVELFPPGREDESLAILNRLKCGEPIEHAEAVRRRKDGTLLHISLTISPVKDEAGNTIGASRIARDITDRKMSEAAAAERLRAAAFVTATVATLTQGGCPLAALQNFTEMAITHLGVALARVWTLNEADGVLELRASAGLYTGLDGPHARVPVGQFNIGRIAQERELHLTNAAVGDPRVSDQAWVIQEGLVAFAGHPLVDGDRVVGVMAVFAGHPLSEGILETLHPVADTLAVAIRRHQLEDEVRELRMAASKL